MYLEAIDHVVEKCAACVSSRASNRRTRGAPHSSRPRLRTAPRLRKCSKAAGQHEPGTTKLYDRRDNSMETAARLFLSFFSKRRRIHDKTKFPLRSFATLGSKLNQGLGIRGRSVIGEILLN